MGNYPHHRRPFLTRWTARPGATVEDAPLPAHTADRTRAIRRIFLEDFAGCATIDDVGAAAEDAGLLDALRTPVSMREAVLRALRPIASTHGRASPIRYAPVSHPSPLG